MHRAAASMPRVRTLPRPSRGVVWALAILALVIAGGMWLRDSSLVAVNRVTVTGLTGPQAAKITSQLDSAARDMTTLHVRGDQLRAVTEPYPVVKDVRVSTDFPHGLRIEVVENTPVAAISVNGSRTPVTADGRIIRGAAQTDLPIVPLKVAPTGASVVDATARHAIAALAAAPEVLRARVTRASTTHDGGLTLALRDGPELRFGGADRLAAKWAAAAAVLASGQASGATYLDLRYPERPAAGGKEDPTTQRDPEAVNSADPTSTTASPQTTTPVTP
jgi:cell division protein FtsQ